MAIDPQLDPGEPVPDLLDELASDTALATPARSTAPVRPTVRRVPSLPPDKRRRMEAAVARSTSERVVDVPTAPSTAPATGPAFPVVAPVRTSPDDRELEQPDARDDAEGEQPASRRERRRATRLRARQVRRVVRRIEPWSVLKVSVLFYVCVWLILVVAGVILWRVAVSAGAIDNVENFIAELLAEKSFTIDGAQVFRASAIAGVILVFAGTGFTVLLTILFNLISSLTGGIRMSVIELETARRAPAKDPSGPETRPSDRRRLRRSR